MKSGMKQIQVPPFDLKLRQDGATASIHPLERLPAPKTAKKPEKMGKRALGPYFPYLPYPGQLRCGEHLRCT